MNQNSRTVLFVAVAALAAIGAWATRPSVARIRPDDEVINKPLAPDFVDPLAARSMEIVDFDESTGEPKTFKVAQVNGIWSLPSKYEYPADAERQLGEAAANLMDLTMLGVASNLASDHPLFGVVDPSTAKVGATGVGKKITLEGEGGKPLLSMIVGKEVKDQPDQRYVRIPGRDAVYPVKINTGKLSTKFEDWIEKDLLKLSGWDISEVVENNYSIDKLQGKVIPGEVVDLKYDDAQSKWSMAGLAAGEELDTTKLNELKSALDDLKIVDVRRKPAGLSAELRREEGIQLDQAALVSLANKGFYLTQDGSLLSNEGETIVHTKDGVEYVLRFGDIATDTEEGAAEKPKDEPAADAKAEEGKDPADKEAPKTGANRYIFVTARFDESLIPKPGETAPAAGEATPAVDATPAEEATIEPAASPDAVPAEEKPAEEKPADEAPAAETPASPAETPAETPAKTPPQGADANAPQGAGGDDGGQDPVTETPPPATAAPAATAPPADAAAPAGPAATPEDPAAKAAEAERLRKQSEYEAKIKKGQERVKELNDRFADWYYVISDDVYKKIRLTRADVIKKPEAPKAEGEQADIPKSPLDDLQQLKDQGLPAVPTP